MSRKNQTLDRHAIERERERQERRRRLAALEQAVPHAMWACQLDHTMSNVFIGKLPDEKELVVAYSIGKWEATIRRESSSTHPGFYALGATPIEAVEHLVYALGEAMAFHATLTAS